MTKLNSNFFSLLHVPIDSWLAHAVEEHASGSGTQTLPGVDSGKQGKKGAPEEDRGCHACALIDNKHCPSLPCLQVEEKPEGSLKKKAKCQAMTRELPAI
eukprot:774825-Amphidinium_carterae.2